MSFDFITLATETDPRRLLRRLDQILGDDDSVANSATPSQSTAYTNYGADPKYGSSGTTPVLSKTAEAELYLLATNFLLYVAMVIIATMVRTMDSLVGRCFRACRLYWERELTHLGCLHCLGS
jgi:hypothetical protein